MLAIQVSRNSNLGFVEQYYLYRSEFLSVTHFYLNCNVFFLLCLNMLNEMK